MAIFKQRLIYFRATTDECRIIRVLHARQSLESQAFPEE
jgi:plasmid stabilization system protein ParE